MARVALSSLATNASTAGAFCAAGSAFGPNDGSVFGSTDGSFDGSAFAAVSIFGDCSVLADDSVGAACSVGTACSDCAYAGSASAIKAAPTAKRFTSLLIFTE